MIAMNGINRRKRLQLISVYVELTLLCGKTLSLLKHINFRCIELCFKESKFICMHICRLKGMIEFSLKKTGLFKIITEWVCVNVLWNVVECSINYKYMEARTRWIWEKQNLEDRKQVGPKSQWMPFEIKD